MQITSKKSSIKIYVFNIYIIIIFAYLFFVR